MKIKNLLLTALATLGLTAATMAQNVPSYVPSNGLVGWWPFNGNANDESGNGNNGSVNGAILTTDRFGNVGKAYDFTLGEIQMLNPFSNFNDTSFTISLWFYRNNKNSADRLFSLERQTAPNNFQFRAELPGPNTNIINTPDFANHLLFHTSDGVSHLSWDVNGPATGPSFISMTSPDTSLWFNLTIVKNNRFYAMYLNNNLQATDSLSGNNFSLSNITYPFLIGGVYNVNGQNVLDLFNGKLDDIGIWNRSLTQQEITNLYNGNICYQTITVTDTLLINMGITGFNPVSYNNTIKIFPNPTNDHITIDYGNFASLSGYQLKIINSLSQNVFQTNIAQQSDYLNLTTWGGNGLYFVQIIDQQGNIIDIRKIVLQ